MAKGRSISVGEIIYVALLHYNNDLKNSYTFCLSGIQKGTFSWIGASCEGIPVEYDKILSSTHASEIQSFCSYYNLSMALKRAVKDTGRTLPPDRMTRPKILVVWNALKGGVDEYSRSLKSYAITTVCENPVVSVIGRMLSTQVANAALVHHFSIAKNTVKFTDDVTRLSEHRRGYARMRTVIRAVRVWILSLAD